MTSQGISPDQIVVVDLDPLAIEEANRYGSAVAGDCPRESVPERARVKRARRVVLAVDRDDTAVLASLTARLLNPHARLVAAVRQEENSRILRSSGASVVITSHEATGQLLGLAIDSPYRAALIEDLLSSSVRGSTWSRGTWTRRRWAAPGGHRGGDPMRAAVPTPDHLEAGDRLLLIQENGERNGSPRD